MKIAIMQPYLFPYIGYFQLMAAVNTFVIYDDVQFIKKGWINRNRFLVNARPYTYTFSVKHASSFLKINEREFADNHKYETMTFLKLLHQNYRSAPFFDTIYEVVSDILSYEELNVARKVNFSLHKIRNYLGIHTHLEESSKLDIEIQQLRGQDRIVAICKALAGDHYLNSIGGQELYNKADFLSNGIKLSFLETASLTYPQLRTSFISNLSIVDVMMFNSPKEIAYLLTQYTLK